MMGDLGGFFGERNNVMLGQSSDVDSSEKELAWKLIQKWCPNDADEIGEMIGVFS